MKFKKSTFWELLTPFLIIGFLLFAGLVAYVSLTAYNKERENIKRYTHAQMKTLILDLETKLVAVQASMTTISHRPHVELDDSIKLYERLEEFVNDQPFICSAGIDFWRNYHEDTGSTALYVTKTGEGRYKRYCYYEADKDVSKDELNCTHEAYHSQRHVWSQPYLDKGFTNTHVVSCYLLVPGQNSMIYADVKMSSLLEVIDSLQFYNDSRMFIEVSNGVTYTLDGTKLVETDNFKVNEDDFIEIRAHYRRLNIDIINVVPKEQIISSIWVNMAVIFLIFVVSLTLIALLVHRRYVRMSEKQKDIERLEGELNVAARIQMRMLTRPGLGMHFAPEDGETVDVMSRIIPARVVGGDLYEYRMKGRYLVTAIGDVSGKGVPASIVMTRCSTLFHAYVSETNDPNPADFLKYMNAELTRRNDHLMFVTMWIGIIDMRTGRLRYASAGHNPPVLLRKDKVEFLELCQGVPLGMFEDSAYPSRETDLKKEDALVLYTDGITEAENERHQLFGDENLLETCRKEKSRCPETLCRTLLKAVERHAAGCPQSDDITLLCLTFGGRYAQLHGVDEVKALHDLVSECGYTNEAALVLEEAAVNAFRHGKATMACVEYKDGAFVMTDDGGAFDPTTYKVPEKAKDELRIGGCGIMLTRMYSEKISYERSQELNITSFTIKEQYHEIPT